MLKLSDITKNYTVGGNDIPALRGVSMSFRESEFVAILGPSGCGKTTLLNIIGGLDQYTTGDLIINGRTTKQYKSRDWDTYRNHSVGFVFQTYNLIPHQSVLSNVELALTLSGVSKKERRERARRVLERVGLGDQLDKKPNQMSGGQMQRVAIARALINDPDILLADEPTGALDSETSVQIMEILKEIAQEKLVIMVTHNPELAAQYSTRTIRLLDGRITDDSNPYDEPSAEKETSGGKKTSMSFFTALSLSFNNLMTKKTRTLLMAFAGSIGIIGIALILSLSSGFQNYINRVEEDTLSTYPLTVESETVDMSTMFSTMMGVSSDAEVTHDMDKIYSNNMMSDMMNTMLSEVMRNDMQSFKEFIDSEDSGMAELTTAVQYSYDLDMNIYREADGGCSQVNPNDLFERMGFGGYLQFSSMGGSAATSQLDVWEELLGNEELLQSQYDVIAGQWPQAMDEVVLIVDENNEISEYTLYSLGLKDPAELDGMMAGLVSGEPIDNPQVSYSYDELLALRFKLVLNTAYYQQSGEKWVDMSGDADYMSAVLDDALELKVVGILRPNEAALATSVKGSIGYSHELTEYLINGINGSDIVKQQLAAPETDVFTGLPFSDGETDAAAPEFDISSLSEEQQAYMATLTDEELAALAESYAPATTSEATYDGNLTALGVVELDKPSVINIYPKDFASKEKITDLIAGYNQRMTDVGNSDRVVQYTDYVGLIMSSVSTIIDTISYVLIAFVAISLIVSSIMIGIITYISVLERTKEIGILRSIGASKRDISRVFNAETLIVGFVSGMLGILVTLLLNLPINAIINNLASIEGVAQLPLGGAVILVAISMLLTFIAGLIPARIAAKKDPVVALRTE